MPWVLAFLVSVLLAPAPEVWAPEVWAPGGQAKGCKKCRGDGRIACAEHPREECALEDAVLYCSVVEGCPACGGAGFVGCSQCKDEEASKKLSDSRARIQARKALLQPIDDKMGRPLRKAETAHYVFIWEMDKFKVEKRWVGPHEALHVYIDRMEKFFADYGARLSTAESEFSKKSWIFVWLLPEDHREGSARFCEQTAKAGVKLMGSDPRYSVCGNKQHYQSDEELYRNLVHCGTHLLLSHQQPPEWIGNLKAGWADEGLAHWFEDRYWGVCDTYCYQEADTNIDFAAGKYRLATRKMVVEGKTPPIASVLQQNVDTLTLPMHLMSFSYVDFLMSRDGAKFKELVKKLKAKTPSRDALQAVYGMSPIEMEAQWKAWVLATYPTR